jgi:AGCS family alanine or glycine:cation symporter
MHHGHIRFVEQRMRDIFVGGQYSAGIKTPVFDSSQFKDLDLDLKAWPNREKVTKVHQEHSSQVASVSATQ